MLAKRELIKTERFYKVESVMSDRFWMHLFFGFGLGIAAYGVTDGFTIETATMMVFSLMGVVVSGFNALIDIIYRLPANESLTGKNEK